MNQQKWSEIKRVFSEAVDLAPEKRKVFLAENCPDEEIHAEVCKLIASDGESETISGGFFTPREISPPKQIANYKILEELGSGGMGTVFLAVREDLQKQVALKVVKYEFSSKEIKRRFENEGKILAQLEHQNIARLFDGGTTNDGLPYFVMEYVAGDDLLVYCNENQLNIEERLKIFRKICAAVSYAHGKLIVHRDIKPSNIIVTSDGEPKLLDFGISKLLDENSLGETGTATAFGMLTPNYASPEQFRGETVGTSTDIYSLGVILYELLTGKLPYKIREKRIDEIARAVCEIEPTAPSRSINAESGKRNAEYKTASSPVIENNQRSASSIQRSLRGDLDNIILKTLRKEPERRYSSVEQFSEDIRRYLEGLPISARPDTFGYRAEKFIKRNRGAVVAGSSGLMMLIGGITAVSWQYVRAERERKLAEKRFREVRELAHNVIYKYHDSIINLPGSTHVREILVKDATAYLDNLASDAGADEELQRELALAYIKLADVQGRTYYSNIGDTTGAIKNYKKGVEILESQMRSKDAVQQQRIESDLINAYQPLGMLQSRIFAHRESINTQSKALKLVERQLESEPENDKYAYALVRAMGRLADSMRASGDFSKAMNLYRDALDLNLQLTEKFPQNEDIETAIGVINDRIGRGLALRADEIKNENPQSPEIRELLAEAIPRLEKMFEVFSRLSARRPENKKYKRDLSTAYDNLGIALRLNGNLDESLKLLDKNLQTRRRTVESDAADRESQGDLAEVLMERAKTLAEMKNFDDAFANLMEGLQIMDALIGEDDANMEFHRRRFELISAYAETFLHKGEKQKAFEMFSDGLEKLRLKTGKSDAEYISKARLKIEQIISRS
jgi:eukaryotic-like serine/threonine-protein kinase